jgi:AmiR/NasT family two-component response regulator
MSSAPRDWCQESDSKDLAAVADEAAKRGDYADALGCLQAVEAAGKQLRDAKKWRDSEVAWLDPLMSYRETEHLRVLIANDRKDRLALVAPVVVALGHEVIASEIDVEDVGAVTARERPDVALVGLGESSEHALGLIDKIVREAACPVIVLLHAPDPDFVREASKRGVFAHISDADTEDWQSSIDIMLRRFTEYHDLEGAFGRRTLTERAKGILMERHTIDEDGAYQMLRERSRIGNRKLIDLAAAIVDGHCLPLKPPHAPAEP